jgi:hypothetical protein
MNRNTSRSSGEGVRFFDHLGPESIGLERTRVIEAPGIRFCVVK